MNDHAFTLAGAALRALPSGALHWPDQSLLVVSDLHFGKSERLARRGGALLPPYETRETLARLDADLTASAARRAFAGFGGPFALVPPLAPLLAAAIDGDGQSLARWRGAGVES